APEGYDARLVADLAERAGGPVIHVARDDARAAAMAEALAIWAPALAVFSFPAWDCLPYDRVSPNPDLAAARMAVLARLATAAPSEPAVLVTTVNAATQKVPARATLADAAFTARPGQRVEVEALTAWLARMGFNRASTVAEPGDYAIRGGIIDIFPPGRGTPVRLDFFGDVMESARRFDATTQRTEAKIKRVALAPASEVILDDASIQRFRTRFRETFGAPRLDDPLYAAVSEGRKHQGMEHWAPLFHERMETVFDYLPGAPVALDDQVDAARTARAETIHDHYQARIEAARAGSTQPVRPCPPDLLYLDDRAWAAALHARPVRAFTPHRTAPGPGVIDAGGRGGRNFAPERQADDGNLFHALGDHLRARLRDGPVILATYSEGARERMAGLLEDQGFQDIAKADHWRDVGKGLTLMVWALEAGFTAREGTVVAEQDILGDRLIRRQKRSRRAENFLTEAQSLMPGDLVVHVDHGIGRYLGLETVTAAGAPHECLALEYHGAARL
ncbi:MAG: CarD family transcriptional regulator, partial [Pseudomonadota bacterium]